MKNNSPNSANATGRRYWRSLDELADTPEFKDWLHREFPVGASEMVEDGTSRRHFLKIMSASFALAGVATLGAGCRRPEEHLEPFGKQPENSLVVLASLRIAARSAMFMFIYSFSVLLNGQPTRKATNTDLPRHCISRRSATSA